MEHDSDLSAGGVALCGEGRLAAGGDAGDDAGADSPLHCRDGKGADLRLIGIAAQRTAHGRTAFVAVQDSRDLLTGDIAVRVEGRGGRAVDNAHVGGPEDCVVVVLALLVVGELVGDPGNGGLACRTVEDRDEHGAGHLGARPEELRVLGVVALDDVVHVHEVDRVGRPLVRTAHVGELTGGRLLVDLEGQRALRWCS